MKGLLKVQRLIGRKGAGEASPEQLALINDFALRELAAEEVYVREYVIAHNAIDRDGEVFDESLLDNFAASLPGKGLFVKHPNSWDGDSGPGEGRWFAARVERMPIDQAKMLLRDAKLRFPPDRDSAAVLMAQAYMVRTASSDTLIAKIDAGIAGDVSIGFIAKGVSDIADDAGSLIAKRLHGPGEALEASLVWLGAQPGARAVKHASHNPPEDSTVDPKELQAKLDAANAKIAEAETQAKVNADFRATLAKSLGDDHKALAADPAALAKAALSGIAYRAALIDDIVAGERAKGLVPGDDEASVTQVKSLYATADTDVLEARAKAVRVQGNAGIKGGDPNTPKPGPASDLPDALQSAAI